MELQRHCPLCRGADVHVDDCALQLLKHIRKDDETIDWPATLKLHGIAMPAPEIEGLKIVGEITSMSLKPGDVVIVKCKGAYLSDAAATRIHEMVSKAFPDHAVLVFDPDIDLLVGRRE